MSEHKAEPSLELPPTPQVARSALFIVSMSVLAMALLLGIGGWLLFKALNSQAESGKSLALQVQEACESNRLAPRDREDLCADADRVIREVPIEDPEIQEPEVQENEIQEPEIQEPEIQESEDQQREEQDAEEQDSESQDAEIQEPEEQEPEEQEPENQDPEIDDPEPNDPQDPPGSITLTIDGTTYVCTKDDPSPPEGPSYTCTEQP